MLKELEICIQAILRNKSTYEKQELERNILFWCLKGTSCVLALVFLAASLFIGLSHIVEIYLATLITAGVSFLVCLVIHLVQAHCNKIICLKKYEQLLLLIPVVEAFIEGLNFENRNVKEKPDSVATP